MQGDMLSLVALDFILRVVMTSVVGMAFVVHVPGMDFDNLSADVSRFGIPPNMVTDLEAMSHFFLSWQNVLTASCLRIRKVVRFVLILSGLETGEVFLHKDP